LIHISTDCVFSGKKGRYCEADPSDAEDLYGKSKHIGEVTDRKNTITLRTSIIGHELKSQYALLEWFLAQESSVYGYSKAIFSGVPTNELARIIKDYVLPREDLNGLYHISADPISKFDLLHIIARQYKKEIDIIEDSKVVVDRSLSSDRFFKATGYRAPDWSELIKEMWEFSS
jgi:dTDP-4-dehydrorhamnose reductase